MELTNATVAREATRVRGKARMTLYLASREIIASLTILFHASSAPRVSGIRSMATLWKAFAYLVLRVESVASRV